MLYFFVLYQSSAYATADASASTANTSPLAQQCVELFQKADNLVDEAKNQPGRHLQLSSIQNKLQDSKKQISSLDLNMQEMSCEKGLIAFNSLTE